MIDRDHEKSKSVSSFGLEPDNVESIRRANYKVERSIKSIGLIYYSCAILWVLLAAVIIIDIPRQYTYLTDHPEARLARSEFYVGMLLLSFGIAASIANFLIGRGLRSFRSWSRNALYLMIFLGTCFAIEMCRITNLYNVDLMVFSIVLIIINTIHGYMVSRKEAATLFSGSYARVLQETPQLRCPTSWTFRIFMITIILPTIGFFWFRGLAYEYMRIRHILS